MASGGNDTAESKANAGAMTMFAPSGTAEASSGDESAQGANIDLDELFRDYYALGEFSTAGTGIPADGAGVNAPVPGGQAAAPTSATDGKRKAEEASLDTASVPIPAAAAASGMYQVTGETSGQLATSLATSAAVAPTTTPTTPIVVSPPGQAVSVVPSKPDAVASGQNMAGAAAKEIEATGGVDDINLATGKPLTDQQKVERRERNREHAKRSRLRKKFLLESLQEQIHGLQTEIESLKDIIRKELPDKAESLLSTVCAPTGKYNPLPMPSGFGPVKTLMEPDYRLMSALSGSQQNFAISDPSLPDNPIVYVSQGFLDLTGYTLDQVLGRNCRFLQGPGTDQSAVDVIRRGIREGVDTSVCLLNYRADGTPFWNQFFVAALRDAENNVVNYVGVQCEVSKAVVEKQMAESGKPAAAAAAAGTNAG